MGYRTQDEKDEDLFKYRNFIADKFVDLQKFPMSLRDVEDQEGTEKIIKKIEDACVAIHQGYVRLEDIEYTEVDGDSMYSDDGDGDGYN